MGDGLQLLPATEAQQRHHHQQHRRPLAADRPEDEPRAAARAMLHPARPRPAGRHPERHAVVPLHIARLRGAAGGRGAADPGEAVSSVQRRAQQGEHDQGGAPHLDPQAAVRLQPGGHPHVLVQRCRHGHGSGDERLAPQARARWDLGAAGVRDEPDDLPGQQVRPARVGCSDLARPAAHLPPRHGHTQGVAVEVLEGTRVRQAAMHTRAAARHDRVLQLEGQGGQHHPALPAHHQRQVLVPLHVAVGARLLGQEGLAIPRVAAHRAAAPRAGLHPAHRPPAQAQGRLVQARRLPAT
mmetsp:Transcript_8951/g.21086  ORF Transcript_8951/g.21086 Transcript_8951/m.21086 type:complete len:297 (-) Transcript_8951:470-1360(-)